MFLKLQLFTINVSSYVGKKFAVYREQLKAKGPVG
jgi:hypothetical protein